MSDSSRLLVSVPLEILNDDAGQTRTDLPPRLAPSLDIGFRVDYYLLYEIHGGFELGDKDNASFVVIQMVPHIIERKHQFVTLRVSFSVICETSGKGQDEEADEYNIPEIISFEPASSGAEGISVLTTNETLESMIKADMHLQIQGVSGPGGEVSRTTKSEFTKSHQLLVNSQPDSTIGIGGVCNKVTWDLKAATKQDGIGDSFTVALLIKRPNGSRFSIQAETDGRIGSWKQVMKKLTWNNMSGLGRPRTIGTFGPMTEIPKKVPEGIKPENLHAAFEQDTMKNIKELGMQLVAPAKIADRSSGETSKSVDPRDRSSLNLEQINQPATKRPEIEAAASCRTVAPLPSTDRLADSTSKRRTDFAFSPTGVDASHPTASMVRWERHRKMAALYERLAKLHREEAEEYLPAEEVAYADRVEMEDLLF